MTWSTLDRDSEVRAVRSLLARSPVVAILGARQVGKTTLAKQVARDWRGEVLHLDLEDDRTLRRLQDPFLVLEPARGLVVLDEIQRRPEIFPTLRVLVDRDGPPARFLVLGSASPHLLRQGSESLAGRIAFHDLGGFGLDEVGPGAAGRLWLRGGFPRSFLAATDAESSAWRQDFVRTFLERDLPQLGVGVPAATLRRFWSMLAHYHGQVWSGAELARSLGVSGPTVRRYLDLLAATFVVRILPPWHENLAKRQVRSPKVFVSDPGILHSLLGIETTEDLEGHPKAGASFEGYAGAAVVRRLGARPDQCWFWATHTVAELDLLVVAGRRRLGFEFKRTSAPEVTKSMRVATEDLRLESLTVVHAGAESFPLAKGIRAVALERVFEDLEPLRRG